MSQAKHDQLIAEGKLWPDGSMKETCPLCLREFAQGESIPPGVHGVASADAVTVETEVSQ